MQRDLRVRVHQSLLLGCNGHGSRRQKKIS
jgi:hypothetical protein